MSHELDPADQLLMIISKRLTKDLDQFFFISFLIVE